MADPVEVVLLEPVQFGSERIEKLTLKPNGRSMQGLVLPMKGDGTIYFEPYALAKVGLHMAAKPTAVLDLMHPGDVTRVAMVVLGFTQPGRETGTEPLQS